MKSIFNKSCIVLLFTLSSCMNDWLEVRSDKKSVIPSTLEDARALLNNNSVFLHSLTPALGEVSTDDFYIPSSEWDAHTVFWEKNAYAWNPQIFVDNNGMNNWSSSYRTIYYSNLVLELLEGLPRTNEQYDYIKGSALFYRSFAFYQLAQIFCEVYDPQEVAVRKGLPLKLTTDLEERLERASLRDTYEQIDKDIREATLLLPVQVEIKTHPSRAAGFIFQSKVFLATGRYEEALKATDEAFRLDPKLMDFNALDNINQNNPFRQYNDEVVLQGGLSYSGILAPSKLLVSPALFELYKSGDLRKNAFFSVTPSGIRFKGSYFGTTDHFGGISWNEAYLIRSESLARTGKVREACDVLSTFLKNRYAAEVFNPFVAENKDYVLSYILAERRKELLFRGIRWTDVKRLNHFYHENISMRRASNTQNFILMANDKKSILPIPDEVVNLGGYQQNER